MGKQEQNHNNLKYKLPVSVRKAANSLKEEGLAVCRYKMKNRLHKRGSYDRWIARHENMEAATGTFDYQPVISVLVFCDRSEACMHSVARQTYGLKECIVVDQVSTESVYNAVKGAKGEFVVFLNGMDILAPDALQEIVRALDNDRRLDYIYSDEDSISEDGKRRWEPLFKPDWSPDTLISFWYTGHLAAYRTSLLLELTDLFGDTPFWEYDLALRFTEHTNHIGHIAKVLYHKTIPDSMDTDKKISEKEKAALYKVKHDMITRRRLNASLDYIEEIQEYRLIYHVPETPKISIVIPSKDNFEMLSRCVDSILAKTAYENYEIIVVDNGSRDESRVKISRFCEGYGIRYLYKAMPFNFSKMCNLGAEEASGDFYLFLNDDIQVKDSKDWLSILLGHASQSHVGAAGCKLYYPDSNLIQHCGVMNSFVGPDHIFHHMCDKDIYYLYRNKTDTNFSAVTAACMMVSKEKFHEVSGFDETLRVAYNDVDFCLKLLQKGYYNVLRADVILWHFESFSRGDDYKSGKKARRLKKERDCLFSRYPWFRYHDPCYNENLTKIKIDSSVDDTDYWLEQFPAGVDELSEIICQLERKPELKPTIKIKLEDIYEDTYVRLTGYAFDRKKRKAGKVVLLLLSMDGTGYQFTSKGLYRKDIVQIYGEKGLAFCGFYFKFNKERLKPGWYYLYLKANRQIVKLEKQIYVRYRSN